MKTTTNLVIETNIDDQTPESLSFACELLLAKGALDVYLTPIFMKKGRLGSKLTVLCELEKKDLLIENIFIHTNAIGVRVFETEKVFQDREIKRACSSDIKITKYSAKPEFEHLKTQILKNGELRSEVFEGDSEIFESDSETSEDFEHLVPEDLKSKSTQTTDHGLSLDSLKTQEIFNFLLENEKFSKLVSLIANQPIALAFSGGVDSTFLAFLISLTNPNHKVITVKKPYIPDWEVEEAIEFAKKYNLNHTVIELGIPENVRLNPLDRCYLCKRELFSQIIRFAEGYTVIDGSNFDDLSEHRPGRKALGELSVSSPLAESGIMKSEIRLWSKYFSLRSHNKAPYACLLTRLEHDKEYSFSDLKMIEQAENFLRSNGYDGARVRKFGKIAVIELMNQVMDNSFFAIVHKKLIELGFERVTLDLGGYRIGSMK